MEDQPNAEVGGSVERAGLSGSHCLVCRPGGERSFTQVLTFGVCLVFYIEEFTFFVITVDKTFLHKLQ